MALTLMKGSEAIAEAAIRAGARFFFGYPITPQTEIPEYMSARMPEIGGCFLQAESEVAAINMVYGAAGTGARVITSSSSPGVSLKQEGISYCAGAMVPAVIINVMRGGPGLGNIQASQGDYFQGVKGGGNGDYHLLTFAPASVQEAIDLMMIAYDKEDHRHQWNATTAWVGVEKEGIATENVVSQNNTLYYDNIAGLHRDCLWLSSAGEIRVGRDFYVFAVF